MLSNCWIAQLRVFHEIYTVGLSYLYKYIYMVGLRCLVTDHCLAYRLSKMLRDSKRNVDKRCFANKKGELTDLLIFTHVHTCSTHTHRGYMCNLF